MSLTGYRHPDYAMSLAEFGRPLSLPRSGGWLLVREIDDRHSDAMGPYPLFVCLDWRSLNSDFEEMSGSLVSVVVVTDPFGEYDEPLLQESFRDLVTPFKSHFVRDLSRPMSGDISTHHARNACIGLREVVVEQCENPGIYLDDWVRLYSVLMLRHRIEGIRAFSRDCFAKQLSIPGLVCFRAIREERAIGMTLWYVFNGVAYYHLGAYAEEAYRLNASFALFLKALEYFSERGLRYANLGAGAGTGNAPTDGLSRFKRGWSTETRLAYLCGRVFNRREYDRLARARGIKSLDYFPAYRKGEFN